MYSGQPFAISRCLYPESNLRKLESGCKYSYIHLDCLKRISCLGFPSCLVTGNHTHSFSYVIIVKDFFWRTFLQSYIRYSLYEWKCPWTFWSSRNFKYKYTNSIVIKSFINLWIGSKVKAKKCGEIAKGATRLSYRIWCRWRFSIYSNNNLIKIRLDNNFPLKPLKCHHA